MPIESFKNKGYDKPIETCAKNTFLAIMEYILEVGVEEALLQLKGASLEEVEIFPHVAKALKDRGLLEK